MSFFCHPKPVSAKSETYHRLYSCTCTCRCLEKTPPTATKNDERFITIKKTDSKPLKENSLHLLPFGQKWRELMATKSLLTPETQLPRPESTRRGNGVSADD
jgi:hypothetical protein